MSARARLFLLVIAGIVLVIGTTTAFAAVAVLKDGTVSVEVHEAGGSQLSLSIPASLVRAALTLTPTVHSTEMEAAMVEIRPHWPLVREACARLAGCPDGVLVEVEGRDEHVIVAKEHGDLVVRVRDGENRVDVRVPASAVEDAVQAVGRIAGLDGAL
jgi:hypothetical protein